MQTRVKGLWLSYEEATERASNLIGRCMVDARNREGNESLVRREWAYGVYIGWRALTEDMIDHATFSRDDERLDSLLKLGEPTASSPVLKRGATKQTGFLRRKMSHRLSRP